ncbi:MAG: serine hydroxymethyltransferase, partial [Candidatus Hadarchaeales archaeon]
RHYQNPGGIRLGVSEVTRLGMKEEEMGKVAEFIVRVVKGEDPDKVAREVEEFRKGFTKIHYAFDSAAEAYQYIKLR